MSGNDGWIKRHPGRFVSVFLVAAMLGLGGSVPASSGGLSARLSAREKVAPASFLLMKRVGLLQVARLGSVDARVSRPQRRRSNPQTFADPAGDSGNAPDITTVTVSNDGSGNITFQVTVPNRSALASRDQMLIRVDADRNQATGSSGGFEYAIELGASGATLLCLGGSNSVAATAPTLSSSFTAGVLTVAINAAT
jgi:hypothetical protein